MKQDPTEEQIQEWGNEILSSIRGFTKKDFEPLFERFILPYYRMVARNPLEENKWKIVNRETNEEYSLLVAEKELINLGILNVT